MKEYRLVAWPQLRPPFDRIAHRRMLTDLSHRHMTVAQLAAGSSVRRQEVHVFLEMLEARQLIVARESTSRTSRFGSLRPLGVWLRRAVAGTRPD